MKKIQKFKKLILPLIILVLILSLFSKHKTIIAATNNENDVFIPLLMNNYFKGYSTTEKLIGINMQQYWTPTNVSIYMTKADNLAGKKHTISGWFIDINDSHFNDPMPGDIKTNNLYIQLESLWSKGYISFVNLNSTATAFEIANGNYDAQLMNMANVYYNWISLGGGRKAILAPLPEMNGVNSNGKPWATYGGDPINFKVAYSRIINIFSQKGIDSTKVWWSFAPNGWSDDGHEFEKYYPGDGLVDIISFSSYNYGFCYVAIPWERWENYDTLYQPYLDRIFEMASSKPIIIAQTGTTAEYPETDDFNVDKKNKWLRDNYEYISKQPQVLGILYYDFDQSAWECNWKVTTPEGVFSGYRDGAANSAFEYLSINNLNSLIP
jgi:hypothetical protein